MRRVLPARATVLAQLYAIRIVPLILRRRVVPAFALLARQCDDYSGIRCHYDSPTFIFVLSGLEGPARILTGP